MRYLRRKKCGADRVSGCSIVSYTLVTSGLSREEALVDPIVPALGAPLAPPALQVEGAVRAPGPGCSLVSRGFVAKGFPNESALVGMTGPGRTARSLRHSRGADRTPGCSITSSSEVTKGFSRLEALVWQMSPGPVPLYPRQPLGAARVPGCTAVSRGFVTRGLSTLEAFDCTMGPTVQVVVGLSPRRHSPDPWLS